MDNLTDRAATEGDAPRIAEILAGEPGQEATAICGGAGPAVVLGWGSPVSATDVDPAFRNRGIGGALLDWAEARARAGGYQIMSLSTTTVNPARRLYERHGFRVTETLTDPEYQRITGIAGRHRMVRNWNKPTSGTALN